MPNPMFPILRLGHNVFFLLRTLQSSLTVDIYDSNFCKTNNKQSEKEITKTTPFKTASKTKTTTTKTKELT